MSGKSSSGEGNSWDEILAVDECLMCLGKPESPRGEGGCVHSFLLTYMNPSLSEGAALAIVGDKAWGRKMGE